VALCKDDEEKEDEIIFSLSYISFILSKAPLTTLAANSMLFLFIN